MTMAIHFKCPNPTQLLDAIKAEIKKSNIETWSVDSQGDFTHTPDQWNKKAWLRPRVAVGELIFNIVSSKTEKMTPLIYGVYHGRFTEMMLTHFGAQFSTGMSTAQPETGDGK